MADDSGETAATKSFRGIPMSGQGGGAGGYIGPITVDGAKSASIDAMVGTPKKSDKWQISTSSYPVDYEALDMYAIIPDINRKFQGKLTDSDGRVLYDADNPWPDTIREALDDMGKHGLSVSDLTKAKMRVAIGSQDGSQNPPQYSYTEALKVIVRVEERDTGSSKYRAELDKRLQDGLP